MFECFNAWGDARMLNELPWVLWRDIRILQGLLGCLGEMLWCCSEMRECCGEMPGSRKMLFGNSRIPTLMVFVPREVLVCCWVMLWCHEGCSRKTFVFPGEIFAIPWEVHFFSREVPECSLENILCFRQVLGSSLAAAGVLWGDAWLLQEDAWVIGGDAWVPPGNIWLAGEMLCCSCAWLPCNDAWCCRDKPKEPSKNLGCSG